jgi:hypothetical protein
MNRIPLRHLCVFVLMLILANSVCNAQARANRGNKPVHKGLFGLFSGKKSGGKIKAPKNARQMQKEQAKKEQKVEADYAKFVKESKKRAFKIQTPEVQNRMKQNQKDITEREKARKKRISSTTRKARKKYK